MNRKEIICHNTYVHLPITMSLLRGLSLDTWQSEVFCCHGSVNRPKAFRIVRSYVCMRDCVRPCSTTYT